MPKSPVPPSLDLEAANTTGQADQLPHLSPTTLSPRSSRSPRSNPGSPYAQEGFEQTLGPNGRDQTSTSNNGPTSPTITAIPQYPPSPPKTSPKHGRDPSRSFFSNLMASKSSHRLQSLDQGANEAADRDRANGRGRASSKDRVRGKDSTSDLLKNIKSSENQRDRSADRGFSGSDTSSLPLEGGFSQSVSAKKSKPRFGLLNRNRSIKTDDQSRPKPSPPQRLDLHSPSADASKDAQFSEPMKTAPLRNNHREAAFAESIGSSHRNRSADRPTNPRDRSLDRFPPRNNRPGGSLANSNSFKDGAGTQLLSNLHQTGRGAADRLGKAGKGFLGRITRSGSNHERELVTDDNYVCSSINMALVKQTRKTRIAKRMELSKDKTEFWMPALPWRCIDYLNMNGCEEEGLYRIPGSGKDVKHWQRRFDTEHDINLFDEPELYDINTIGSMFKAWLRDLPDEIFPKQVQIKIAEQCMGATKTPQLLRDELSKLPPFNYYLLFAITCHLSLLHSFADKNKMDYRNLCICFQPCLRIDGFCFQFLVQDWKNCWQGCWTEKEFLDEEYRIQAQGDDTTATAADSNMTTNDMDDRAVSSSGSSQHHPAIPLQAQQQQPQSQPQAKSSQQNVLRKENHQNPSRPSAAANHRPILTSSSSKNSSDATTTTNSVGNRTQSSNDVSTTANEPPPNKSSSNTITTSSSSSITTRTTTLTTSSSATATTTTSSNAAAAAATSDAQSHHRMTPDGRLPALNPLSPIKL